MIQGKYISFTSASAEVNTDLISVAKALVGQSIMAKKLTLVTSGSLAFDINNTGYSSTLYLDTDSLYKLSLDANDVVVSSFVVKETTGCPIFLAMVY